MKKTQEEIIKQARNHFFEGNSEKDLSIARLGFIEGAKWMQEQDGWISVEDRLPDDSYGIVLVFIEEQNDLGLSRYCWNCSYSPLHGFTDAGQAYRVTHWQPLPEPPKH